MWTKVTKDAQAGTNVLVTEAAVDYAAGEKIVITSSSRDYRETEELTVVSVNADNRTVTFTPALKFNHRAQIYTAPNGESIDMRCEVGLLSRNIIIQGDDNSARQLYGSHTIAAGGGTLR